MGTAGRRSLDGLCQIGVGLAIWAGYLLITHDVRVGVGAADGRGRALLDAERWLHLDLERASDQWLAGHSVLGWLAAWEYATTYIVTTFAVLGWLWWRRPRSYPWARNTLAVSTLLALLCFWQWPTTPPRLLTGTGFVDIVAQHHPVLSWGGGAVASSADQYAAMPSLHVGWAVWVTVVTLRAGATRLGYSLAGLHLVVTTAVVIATGNHYVFDVVAGAAIVAIAAGEERVRGVAVQRWRTARASGESAAPQAQVAAATENPVAARQSPAVTANSVAARANPVAAGSNPVIATENPVAARANSVAVPTEPSVAVATEPSVAVATEPSVAVATEPSVAVATEPSAAAATELPAAAATEPSVAAATDGRVAAADEFFLQVETATVQQPVGGFVLLDLAEADGPVDLARFRRLLAERIPAMPRFNQRLVPAGRWRHARWQTVPVDLAWHVGEHRLPPGAGLAALSEFVSRQAEQRLARDRPLWRLWFVSGVGAQQAAAVAVMHHAIGDGLGVVDILRQLFEPALPPPDTSGVRLPSLPVRAGLAALGIGQLVLDGRVDRLPFGAPLSGSRALRCASTPLEPVLELARRTGTRVTDVLLAATGEALAQLECRGLDGHRLRAAVPVTTRAPAPPGTGRVAQPGNLTAALRLDVPLAGMAPLDRLRAVHAVAERRRRSARSLGAAAVVRLLGVLPPALHRLAARGVYRGRHFTAIVSNMPGPSVPLSLAGAPIQDVYPILPLAERVPLAVGSLGWAGRFCVSVTADAERLPAADTLAQRIVDAIEKMQAEAGALDPSRASR